jgi:sigma-B regulation protein RsbU (phosphoserine phosphatase)
VFETKAPVNSRDAQEDARHFQGIGRQLGRAAHAMLTIPLLEGAECVGVLQALNPRGREHFDHEDEEIFEGFGSLIANALMRLEAERHEIEIARSHQQMEVAREIQESFLPPEMQKFPFCQVHLRNFPAHAVGGDFCCVHRLGGERLLVGLGDVTGKGIPASLTMARATAMIKATAGQIGAELGEWVTRLNQQLVEDLQGGRFIGLTFMLADAAAATLQVCAAGQFAPLRYQGERWQALTCENQLPLGILEAVPYRAVTVPLRRGEYWLLHSDGISEARNRLGEDFTAARLLASLPLGCGAAETAARAVAEWRAFVGTAPQHDDASLLVLDWRGGAPTASLEMVCCAENLKAGRAFVEEWAGYAGYDDVTIGQIVMACDEAATNVFRHGYCERPGPIAYHAEVDDKHLTIWMADRARPVKRSEIHGRDLDDLRPGGLGTIIIEKVFDEVIYTPEACGTTLTLRKALA